MDIDALRSAFSYDPNTGVVERRSSGKSFGSMNSKGYLIGIAQGKVVGVHRVAYALHTGEWPRLPIDHINWDRADNRASNLRMVTRSQNARNSRLSPGKGVRRERNGRYSARFAGRHIGTFDSVEEAHAAYVLARV